MKFCKAARLVATLSLPLGSAVIASAAPLPGGVDLLELAGRSRGGELELRLVTRADFAAPGIQVLIDTDGDAAPAFASEGERFEYLIEGEQLFRFAGASATDWSWTPVAPVKRRAEGNTLVLGMDPTQLASRSLRIVARTIAADYAPLDRAPAAGTLTVELPEIAEGSESAGDPDDPTHDITSVALSQDGGNILVAVHSVEASQSPNTLIFLDGDQDDATGYRPSGTGHGFDFVVNGDTLSQHTGEPAAWSWQPVATVARQRDGVRLIVTLDAGILDSDHLRAAVWNMSPDWMTAVDRAPDRGLYELAIDTSKVTSSVQAPIEQAAPKANRHLSARERMAAADSFYVYYGSGQVAALSHYDVVIAHSPQMKPEDIAALKALGVVVVGYITVGEDDRLREGDGSGPGGNASWYMDSDGDGRPDQNSVWKSYFANPLDPKWREDRVAEARRLVEADGYDGIFLDTIDTVARFPETEDGMVALVEAFRETLPDSVIVLNQGYSLLDRLAPHADGFMLESFTATYDFQNSRYQLNTPNSLDWHTHKVRQYVTPVLQQHPLKVLVLDYALPGDTDAIQAATDRATTFGFLFAIAPIYLDRVYPHTIEGRHDEKWLERQATPERLSFELPESANGFPMGAVILPSGAFGGYSVAPLVDGIEDRSTLHWSTSAWASAEDGEAPWLEVRFPSPVAAGALEIRWATEGGRYMTSQRYTIKARQEDEWSVVEEITDPRGDLPVSAHALPNRPISGLRIEQPADGGHPTRPNLMWIAQLRLAPKP